MASRGKIVSKEFILSFGKHKGETIEQIIRKDPGYVIWLENEEIYEFSPEIYNEANHEDFKRFRASSKHDDPSYSSSAGYDWRDFGFSDENQWGNCGL